MPTYDYQCEENGIKLEVKHKMNEVVATWGDLCARLGIAVGNTSVDSPVKRLATGGQVINRTSLGGDSKGAMPACNMGSCCGGGCGLN